MPAGNIEKLFYAYECGADAAYIGIKNFSLRAKADNFSADEYEAIRRVKGNKKLYTALNIYFHDSDIETLEKESDYIHKYPLDGFIVSDIGILGFLKKNFPDKEIHLSTQANCVNTEAAKMYHDMGIKRIVLGRELSLKEIEAIKNNVPDLEIEVFAHGAMCLAYSGRCFLSKYLADRSANQGDCAHSCRWQYRVLEESERPGEYFPVVQGENFTSILSSKDLCMIGHLKELKDAGVDSIKIEGRMKSAHYAASVVSVYRRAMDACWADPERYTVKQEWLEELEKVSHRPYTTGFALGKPDETSQNYATSAYLQTHEFVGLARSWRQGRLTVEQRNNMKAGETLEVFRPDGSLGTLVLEEMRNGDGEAITVAPHPQMVFTCKAEEEIPVNAILRRRMP